MKYLAQIDVMTRKEILDPQGKAVKLGLHNLQMDAIDNVRIGKHITLEVDAETEDQARQTVDSACRQLLANLIMEEYTFTLQPA
ncbi:phosphoribosylformylglycinamidine synthase subunit PurS [Rudanella paleaurantiibacter]|uniref:Phosphoribosylformylglycinamidine synthase subunit PurS n=1 Tax=Rudanella paleaurantiibacter TaxID=2614655 RepID=A0A7J5TZB7_9BACT|nr:MULTISPECIES: phosphoribosylformylglycinamidine synthase subunit PurS [Rudanella]KAB7730307.1 phosphoribosylformylglycinamidine synthase subunit PurS [Rudanella paleaurantiibacter]